MTLQICLWAIVLVLLVRRFRHRRGGVKRQFLMRHPLAGTDTGVRSPFRAPAGVRFHRGF